MIKDIFETEPQAVNELGIKFWVHETVTQHIKSKGNLKDIRCMYMELDTGERSIILADDEGLLYKSQGLEAIGAQVDILSLSRSIDEGEEE